MNNPKTVAEIEADPRVESMWNDEGRWWIYLNEGWTCPMSGCGSIVEDTVRECAFWLTTVVKET